MNPRPIWKYAEGLAPVIAVWLILVGWLASALVKQANDSELADQEMIQEWLDETRTFRKTLPDLIRDHAELRSSHSPEAKIVADKREEIREQLRSLTEPTRIYLNQLPGFPVVYRLEVTLVDGETIGWQSPLPQPRDEAKFLVKELVYQPIPQAKIHCEYQVHAVNKLVARQNERHRANLVAAALLLAATILAVLFVWRFLLRERNREIERLTALAEAEHAERELLETRLRQRDAEQAREVAERAALELKSQLYASIGIMAGSYAHNIKNLLVRPNDLLVRCLEAEGLSTQQSGMLQEVRSTLGTVTERLQQILKTIRRDPTKSEMAPIEMFELLRETAKTWHDVGHDKWKLTLTVTTPEGVAWVRGDLSHLQQALENLVFNARDATFEKRNTLREQTRTDPNLPNDERRKKLIEAAGWRGEIALSASIEEDKVIIEIHDNGIGMTPEVLANCLQTHFSTKRDNALYEGYNAGMGLGLSFVAVVFEHHTAKLSITSQPMLGTMFRVEFPRIVEEEKTESRKPESEKARNQSN
jgi:signal transduction histidine kinase